MEPIVLVRKDDEPLSSVFPLVQRSKAPSKRIFVTVLGGIAEVDPDTVPDGTTVEVLDIDTLKDDPKFAQLLSPEARAYAKRIGYL